jgi:transposase
MLTDSAGWHKSKELTLPKNIQLQLLPPYSPELNPTEHLSGLHPGTKGI